MATVQKTISESGSLTTRTLVTTISAPGIRQNAEISVSPNVDASKISYTINEGAETITVTLTNAEYTSRTGSTSAGYYSCRYSGAYGTYVFNSSTPCAPVYWIDFDRGVNLESQTYYPGSTTYTHYFDYTITVTYKTFPDFKVRQSGQLKTASDGWVRVNGQLRQIQQMWARVNGNLKEV